jgi:hypothetical protein
MTASNILFQRLPCKVACYERYHRFLEMTKHYRYWFVNSKCMADEDFVLEYEKAKMKEAADASRFSGLWPDMQRNADTRVNNNMTKHTKPEFVTYVGFRNLPSSSSSSASTDRSKNSTLVLASHLPRVRTTEEIKIRQEQVTAFLDEKLQQKTQGEAPMTEEEYALFIKESVGETPVGSAIAKDRMRDFTSGARWGQGEESFTERLAKLQDW